LSRLGPSCWRSGAAGDLNELASTLGRAYLSVAVGMTDTAVRVDGEGKLHVTALEAIPDPPSLVELRRMVDAMLPRVGVPEAILEVMSWLPAFVEAFTSVSGGRSRLADPQASVAACLTAQAHNISLGEVANARVPALTRDRLGHVDQNCMYAENHRTADPHLVGHLATIPYARALGGGMVAGIDGMRFAVPIHSIYARPNRKCFGPYRGVTYLSMVTDQAVGLAGKVVFGAPRDSLHALDVPFSLDAGQQPDILISDAGGYSDMMFGLCHPLGIEYRAELADMPTSGLGGPTATPATGR
jgi:Tn3 transposase DDE domain